jgi:hypothetical protein
MMEFLNLSQKLLQNTSNPTRLIAVRMTSHEHAVSFNFFLRKIMDRAMALVLFQDADLRMDEV